MRKNFLNNNALIAKTNVFEFATFQTQS